jgi:ferric-dicitrate binding protein FerR (iron transport regulator)
MKSGNDTDIHEELIAKYLSGGANAEEAMQLMDWLEDPENKKHFERFEQTWYGAQPQTKKPSFSKGNAWSRISGEIDVTAKETKLFSGLSLKIAASILLLVVSGLLFFIKLNTLNSNKTITTTDSPEVVTFPDNSKATLFRNTKIEFPETFQNEVRNINLSAGEAFFTVMRDELKPFVVHTHLADIKVLGTEFNVSTDNEQTVISVKEGKVLVYTSVDSIYLTKGTTATIKARHDKIVSNDQADDNAWGYATLKLTFKDVPLEIVIRDLERTYPCSISLSNKNINRCKLTATFDNNSVENIVNLIAETLNLTVKRNDKIFTLEGEGCP